VSSETPECFAPVRHGTEHSDDAKHSDERTVAHVLVEALPYIRRFAGKTVVVKYGGNALAGTSDHDALALFAQDIVLMRLVGMRPVVVHGGGPQISSLMTRLGKTAEFRDGMRITDADTVDIARMVLIGQVNPQLVTAINLHGNYAVGVSGEDAGLIRAAARDPRLGFVGDVSSINPAILDGLLADEFIPVVATIGTDEHGQAYNINADAVAGAIAEALAAEKLVYLTDVEGLRRDVADAASLIRQTTADELESLIGDGTIVGGMIPKVSACVHAVRNGVGRAHILDGRIAHVLLLEIFTDSGIGTMITGGPRNHASE
jgi:acetylglutamate kinase